MPRLRVPLPVKCARQSDGRIMLAAFGLGDECSNFSVVDGRAKAAASSFSPSIAPSLAPVPAPLGYVASVSACTQRALLAGL